TASLARGGLPVLRRPEPWQQHVPAGCGRCQGAGCTGFSGLLAHIPAARAHPDLRARPGLVPLPAAARLRCRRRLDGGGHLRRPPRVDPVPAPALARLAAHQLVTAALKQEFDAPVMARAELSCGSYSARAARAKASPLPSN